jgi:transcriptional regulator with XRE-family HTH domain
MASCRGSMLLNLKTTIAARRLTQVDLALHLRIPPTALSEIIHGRRQADPGLRARIAEALRADEEWLFSSITPIPQPLEVTARRSAQEPTR